LLLTRFHGKPCKPPGCYSTPEASENQSQKQSQPAVAEFGRSKQAWFATFLDLPNGIPSHDTFWRVFRALDPEQFQTCFLNWMQAVSPLIGGQVIALDGKQLRRSHDRGGGQAAISMVSAWATAHRLVLGQRTVAAKANEITAIPELLQALDQLQVLESRQPAPVVPLYLAAASPAELASRATSLPARARVKDYIGISPDEWEAVTDDSQH
jgi:hypothetical protein